MFKTEIKIETMQLLTRRSQQLTVSSTIKKKLALNGCMLLVIVMIFRASTFIYETCSANTYLCTNVFQVY